jgi:hypothetical protein
MEPQVDGLPISACAGWFAVETYLWAAARKPASELESAGGYTGDPAVFDL